jgi:hypothetical protein
MSKHDRHFLRPNDPLRHGRACPGPRDGEANVAWTKRQRNQEAAMPHARESRISLRFIRATCYNRPPFKKGKAMAHKVKFAIPQRELGNSDLEFVVFKNGQVFGKLLVSKGAIVWRRKWKSKRGEKLGWTRFDKFMKEHGRPVSGG